MCLLLPRKLRPLWGEALTSLGDWWAWFMAVPALSLRPQALCSLLSSCTTQYENWDTPPLVCKAAGISVELLWPGSIPKSLATLKFEGYVCCCTGAGGPAPASGPEPAEVLLFNYDNPGWGDSKGKEGRIRGVYDDSGFVFCICLMVFSFNHTFLVICPLKSWTLKNKREMTQAMHLRLNILGIFWIHCREGWPERQTMDFVCDSHLF